MQTHYFNTLWSGCDVMENTTDLEILVMLLKPERL